MTDETSKFDALVKQWDDYLETDRSFLEGFLLAQQMRDRIEQLTAERDRQYDENAHRIAMQAKAEAERDRLREALVGMCFIVPRAVKTLMGQGRDSVLLANEIHRADDKARAALKGETP